MNLERVVFGFFIILALALNLGFVAGEIEDSEVLAVLGAPVTAGITGTPEWEEDWTLEPAGNWTGYVQKTSGSTGA